MIETTEIKNYQPHKHTVLEFSPGVNVIKGSSHGGKSSIWRAFKWVLQNRPLGEGFRSHFANKDEDVEVNIEFDNAVVSRVKGKNKNQYEVSGHPDPLEAIRSDLPMEVQNASQITEVNLSGQDDPYFLILDSPGKVARALNSVVGLDIIDISLSKCSSITSKAKSHKQILKKDLDIAKDKLGKLDWVDNAQVLIDSLQDKLDREYGLDHTYRELSKVISSITEAKKEIGWINDYLKVKEPAQKLQSKIKAYQSLREDINNLLDLTKNMTKIQSSIKDFKLWLEIDVDAQRLKGKVTRYVSMRKSLRHLKTVHDSINKLQIDVNSANKHVKQMQEQHDKLLKSAGVCPLCGRAW